MNTLALHVMHAYQVTQVSTDLPQQVVLSVHDSKLYWLIKMRNCLAISTITGKIFVAGFSGSNYNENSI